MLHIIWQTITGKKFALMGYSLAAVLFMWMYVALFPSISEQTADFEEFLDVYPEGFTKAFNIEDLSFETLENFVSVEHISIVWPLMALFLVISFAGFGITKEIESGTMELLLAQPVSRMKIFLGRYLGALASFSVFTLISFLCVVPLAELHGVDYHLDHFLVAMLVGYLFGWAIMSIGFMFSVIFSERNRVYMSMGALLFLMYLAKIIINFNEDMELLQYVSFFHYFDGTTALVDGIADGVSVLVFVGCIVVSFAVGLAVFNKRDVAV